MADSWHIAKRTLIISIRCVIGVLLIMCMANSLALNSPLTPIRGVVLTLSTLNLGVHETGHAIFSLLGTMASMLGASFLQLVPPALLFAYTVKRNRCELRSFALFWIGLSLVDMSYYISDASAKALPVSQLGPMVPGSEDQHDWNYILDGLGLLWIDKLLGQLVYHFGLAFYVVSVLNLFCPLRPAQEGFSLPAKEAAPLESAKPKENQ